jgi:glycosyltransferase involved in cell wall biosynthesis
MEAWLNETPVLVHRECEVTLEHCLAAQGGLYFDSEAEFKGTLDFLLAHPEIAVQLGRNGRNYVEASYGWDKLVMRLIDSLESWLIA